MKKIVLIILVVNINCSFLLKGKINDSRRFFGNMDGVALTLDDIPLENVIVKVDTQNIDIQGFFIPSIRSNVFTDSNGYFQIKLNFSGIKKQPSSTVPNKDTIIKIELPIIFELNGTIKEIKSFGVNFYVRGGIPENFSVDQIEATNLGEIYLTKGRN